MVWILGFDRFLYSSFDSLVYRVRSIGRQTHQRLQVYYEALELAKDC